MKWANFLHIYQPPDQKKFIMDKVVSESYRVIISILKQNPHARITMSVVGCLLVKLDNEGYQDVIGGLQNLVERGQIELTAGTMYHPFLPKLPDSEIFRQIKLNDEVHRYYFRDAYRPKGFYSPEAGYSYHVAEIASALGYSWMIVDEISYSGYLAQRKYDYSHTPGFYSGGLDLRQIVGRISGEESGDALGVRPLNTKGSDPFVVDPSSLVVDYSKLYTIRGLGGFMVHFRERVISDALASGQITDPDQFLAVVRPEHNDKRYLLTGTDGEAYGHHQKGLDHVLGQLYFRRAFETITISELTKYFPVALEVEPIPSTWGTSEEEISGKNYYARWHHIDNVIHDKQWELTNLAIASVQRLGASVQGLDAGFQISDYINQNLENRMQDTGRGRQKVGGKERGIKRATEKNGVLARKMLDESLYSCHYWWASARPWWSIELIERGARALADVVAFAEGYKGGIREVEQRRIIVGLSAEALRLYQDIIFTAFDWLRSEKVWDLSHRHK